MNTRSKAITAIQSFLKSDNNVVLLTGTYQDQKHIIALSSILKSVKEPKKILFRINGKDHIKSYLSPLFPGDTNLEKTPINIVGVIHCISTL